ncbi:MAG: ATP-binding protein [Gammaproteobacteria bacterium]
MRTDISHRDREGAPAGGPSPTTLNPNADLLASEHAENHVRGMQHLVTVVQRLSQARTLESIQSIVRRAARELTHADGATFVLRDVNLCYYADEDAISPLWKGQRFPMSACISGWAMLNRQSVIIEDIYADARIPHDAYRPTFVKSLVMMPIRTVEPIGAIGAYWASRHKATPEEVNLLQALADSTSVAMEAAGLFATLEKRVAERTEQLAQRTSELEVLNRELEAFSYSVAHDLRAPLITIDGFAEVLKETSASSMDAAALGYLGHMQAAVARMHRLIEDLLGLSKIVRVPMVKTEVDVTAIGREIAQRLRDGAPARAGEIVIAPDLGAQGDPGLIRIVLENLLSNAWKFTSKREQAQIELDTVQGAEGSTVFRVKDNGAGFDPRYATKLFGPFQRCHAQSDFPGTGIGLATVQRIVHRHGGKIWVEAQLDRGATFYFTLSG